MGLKGKRQFGSQGAPRPIYIVGDSHVSCFAEKEGIVTRYPDAHEGFSPNLTVIRLGAALAGTMHREDTTMGGRSKSFDILEQRVETGSVVFFLLGEIDCRAHIVKRAGFLDSRLAASVESTVANYISFLEEARRMAEGKDVIVGVIAPPPISPDQLEIEGTALRRFIVAHRRNPALRVGVRIAKNFVPKRAPIQKTIMGMDWYQGTVRQRSVALDQFRAAMRVHCRRAGMPFIDPADELGTGIPNRGWFDDEVHLSKAAALRIGRAFKEFAYPGTASQPSNAE